MPGLWSHGFEITQVFVGAPVLGELDGGTHQLTGILLKLLFEPFEQGKGIGSGAGETGDDFALADTAHLAGIALHEYRD